MVGDRIDIRKLTLEELSGVINLYPWYAGARMEFFGRTGQADQALIYVGNRRLLCRNLHNIDDQDYSDAAIRAAVMDAAEPKRQIYVVGGDYFSQNQYDRVRESSDNVISDFARRESDTPAAVPQDEGSLEDFYTETLARTYYEQEYYEKAREIYSKLSLRYPEKSAYFADLIEKIDKSI